MRRRTRWILGLLSTASVLTALLLLAVVFIVVPRLVNSQVSGLFKKAGLTDATFELHRATLWKTEISEISVGKDGWLKVGNVAVEYSPSEVLNGDIRSVRVRSARVLVSLDNLTAGGASSDNSFTSVKIPVQSIELESCMLVLIRGDAQLELPLSGTLLRTPSGVSQLNMRAMLDKAPITIAGTIDPQGDGRAEVTADARGVNLASLIPLLRSELRRSVTEAGGKLDVRIEHRRGGATMQPVTTASIELDNGFVVGKGVYEGEVRGLFSKIRLDSIQPLSIPAGQWITFASMKFAGQDLSDARLVFESKSIDDIRIADAQVGWAGGRFKADPLAFAMATGSVKSAISAEHVDLAQVLAVITQGRATGTGRISGNVPVAYDGGRFTFGNGVGASEGPGTLRLGESTASLSQVLDQTDPRFARDAQMKQLKQQILQAMTDFQYDALKADFTHDKEELVVAVGIRGAGRTGSKQPLDITLNFRGFEHGLNSYLNARSRVFNAGQ